MKPTNVKAYIQPHAQWATALQHLHNLILQTELKEAIKWRGPVYTLQKKNVIGLGAFKNYVAIWFFQGVFLKDEQQKLFNAQDGKTKGLRQWRFHHVKEIEDHQALIQQYIQEAIENQKSGKVVKVERRKNSEVLIPPILSTYFDQHPAIFQQFKTFSPAKQREYAEYIQDAKREATQQKRIEKIAALILAGKGLYDQYKK